MPPPAGRAAQPKKDREAPSLTRVLKKLPPGAPGTRKLAERFGESLLCVRYRENPASRQVLTTVELVIDSRPLKTKVSKMAAVRVGYQETQLRRSIKAMGGIWNPEKKIWHVPHTLIRRLGLSDRVVKNA